MMLRLAACGNNIPIKYFATDVAHMLHSSNNHALRATLKKKEHKETIKRIIITSIINTNLINTYIINPLIIITFRIIYIQTGPTCKAVGQNYGGCDSYYPVLIASI